MDKTWITTGLCTSKDGTELGYDYWWAKSAWMNGNIWKKWLANLNTKMAAEGRKVLLLCDNVPSHIHNPDNYSKVRVKYFAPNLTAWIQPNGAGIIQSFKANYKSAYIQKTIKQYEQGEANVFKINQLEAMELAVAAWRKVKPSTIAKCWRHTKLSGPILDLNDPPTTAFAPTVTTDVHKAILALQQSLGVFHAHAL